MILDTPNPVRLYTNDPACNELPLAIALTMDFVGADEYEVNLQLLLDQDRIEAVRSIFFDNSRNAAPVVMSILNSNQTLFFPQRTQRYLPLLMNQTCEFDFSSPAGTGIFKATLMNFIVQPFIWAATL